MGGGGEVSAAHKRKPHIPLPRAEWLGAVTGVLALGLMAALAVMVVNGAQDRRADHEAINALVRQVQGLGGTPVAGPAGARGEPGDSVTGPPGGQGEPGSTGPSGATGQNGKAGTDGSPGPSGQPGAAGPTGPAGATGPQGAQGEAGPAGPQGEQGEQGPKGDTGEQGPPGPTCPDGYSLQAPAYDPDALVCRKDSAPEPSNTPDAPQSNSLALDPQRRQYT